MQLVLTKNFHEFALSLFGISFVADEINRAGLHALIAATLKANHAYSGRSSPGEST